MAHRHSISGGIVEVDNSTLHETKEDVRLDQLLPPDILEDKVKLQSFLESYYTFMNMDEFIYQETETFSDVVLDGIARFRIPDPNNTNDRFFTDETGASSTLILTSPTGDSPAEFTFNGSSSSIVNTTNNTLDLTEFQQKALPIGTKIIYDTGDGTAIGGLSDDTQYFVVFSQDSSIKLSSTVDGSAINLSSVGTGTLHSIKGALPTMSIPLSDINVAVTNGNDLPGSLADSTSEIGKTFSVNGLSSFNNYTATLTTIVKYWVGPGPSWVMNNIESAMDIDRNEDNYLELMQKEIASAIPRDVTVNKRNLYKRIIDFYKVRGSADAVEIFFRLLFNDSVEVEFPYNSTLIPSSGGWDQPETVVTSTNGAVNNSTSVTIIASNENIRLSSKLVVGTTYTLTDDIRVEAINGTAITLSDPAPTLFNASSSSVINITDNTIQLSAVDSLKYAVGTKLTYLKSGGTEIEGLTDGGIYYVISNQNNQIKLSTSSGGSEISLTSLGVLGANDEQHKLIFQINLTDGQEINFVPRGIYLDKKGFLSDTIKIQDSLRYQKFSYLIKTGKNLSDWEYVYDKLVHPAGFVYFAEILIFLELSRKILGDDSFDPEILRWDELTKIIRRVLSAMPIRQPGVIGPEDIPILVEMFASIFLPGVEAKIHKSGTLSLGLKNGVVTSTTVTGGGSGYTSAPVVTASDAGAGTLSTFSPGEGYTPQTAFTAVLTNGSVTSITINSSGKDYNVPTLSIAAPSAITFDGSDDEVAGVGIVNLTDNTIKLTNDEQAALPVGALVTYDSGGGTAISSTPQLENGAGYYIVYSSGGKVKISGEQGGSAIDLVGVGSGTSHTLTGTTATATASKTDGQLESITIAEPGFGYASPPAITFSGIEQSQGSGVLPTVTIGIDSDGRLDQNNITINTTGGGWSNLFGTPAANANAGTIAAIKIFGKADKTYTTAPNIVFPQPTAKDAEGNLLSTNQLAVANFTLDSEGEITGVNISNAGSGYIADPDIKLGSAVNNEVRVADQQEKLILSLNHFMTNIYNGFNIDNFRTIINNGYKQRKGPENFFTSARLYNTNQTIEFLGNNTLETINSSVINKYNTNTFVEIE